MLLIKAVLLFGLFVLGIHSQNIGSFNSECSQEIPKSDLRPKTHFFGSGVIEDRYVVLLGGSYEKGTDQIWEYDLATNIWEVSGNTSFALGKFPSVVERNEKKLLIVTSGSEKQENQVWEYSRHKGLALFKCDEPKLHLHLQGYTVAYSVEQDTLIMFGGRDMKTTLPSALTYTFPMKGQACNGWTQLPTGSNPPERTQHTSFFDDNTNLLHIFGGYDVNGKVLNDWWSLSMANMTWESHAAGSFPILESPAVAVYDRNQEVFYHYAADVNIYDPDTNTWKSGNGCGFTWGNGAAVSQSTLYTFKNSGDDLIMLSNRVYQERPDDQLGLVYKDLDDSESFQVFRRQGTTGTPATTGYTPVKGTEVKHEATGYKLIFFGPTQIGNITLPTNATVQDVLSTECAVNATTAAELEECTLKFTPNGNKQFRGQLIASLGETTLNEETSIIFEMKWRSNLDNAQWWFDVVSFNSSGFDVYTPLGNSTEDHTIVDDWHILKKEVVPKSRFAELIRVNDTDKSIYMQIRNYATGTYAATVNEPFYVDTFSISTCDSCQKPTDPKDSSPNWGLIGGLIGAFVVIVIIAILLVLFYRRRYIKKAYDRRSTQLTMEMKSMNIPEVKNVVVGRKMGAGNYGEVFEGTAWGGTTRVALKRLKKELMDEFLAEAAMLMKLKHPNCVLFLGIYNGISGDRFIVTEFCENGSLLDWLEKKRDQLSSQELLELAFGATTGMAYLAGSNIVHRDLSARNLLVDGSGTVKVADFGMSRAMESGDDFESIEGKFPIRWSAPEVIKSFKFSAKSDVWSMGVTLYEIITFGRVPYGGMSNQEVIEKVVDQGYRLPKPQDCPDRLWELVMKTWSFEPADRPTMQEIAQTIGALLGRQPARTVDQPSANPSGTFSVSTYADVSSVQTGSSSTYTGPPQEPSTGHYDPTNTSLGVSAVPPRTNNPPRGSSKYVDWGDNNNQSMEDDKKPEPEEENLYNNIARDQLMPPDDDAQKGKEEEESLYNA